MLWEELTDVPDDVPENVAFKDFFTADDDVAVTASPLDLEIVADMLVPGAAEEPLPEDVRLLPTLHEVLSATSRITNLVLKFVISGFGYIKLLHILNK